MKLPNNLAESTLHKDNALNLTSLTNDLMLSDVVVFCQGTRHGLKIHISHISQQTSGCSDLWGAKKASSQFKPSPNNDLSTSPSFCIVTFFSHSQESHTLFHGRLLWSSNTPESWMSCDETATKATWAPCTTHERMDSVMLPFVIISMENQQLCRLQSSTTTFPDKVSFWRIDLDQKKKTDPYLKSFIYSSLEHTVQIESQANYAWISLPWGLVRLAVEMTSTDPCEVPCSKELYQLGSQVVILWYTLQVQTSRTAACTSCSLRSSTQSLRRPSLLLSTKTLPFQQLSRLLPKKTDVSSWK